MGRRTSFMSEGMFSSLHYMDSQKIHILTILDMLMKLVWEMGLVVTSIFQCPQEPDMNLGSSSGRGDISHSKVQGCSIDRVSGSRHLQRRSNQFFWFGNRRLSPVWKAAVSAKSTDSLCFGGRLCARNGGTECSECIDWL